MLIINRFADNVLFDPGWYQGPGFTVGNAPMVVIDPGREATAMSPIQAPAPGLGAPMYRR